MEKNIKYYIVLLLLIIQAPDSGLLGQSWLSPWANRQVISVTNYNYQAMIDFQTRLEIDHVDGMQPDFDDIRFTNKTGTETIPYWIEYKEDNVKAVIWVSLDLVLPFATADFFMYYDNDAALTNSNPEETFIFYDDFDTDEGWNQIGDTPSTAIMMYDSLTSVLQKFDNCDYSGSWKSIGDTISSFKLIMREFRPIDSDPSCTIHEYGIETNEFKGINLRRDALDLGTDTEFGLELRDNESTSDIVTTPANQPVGEWVRTALGYSYICHFNLHAMMFTDNMEMTGNVYGETFETYDFDRFTVRGGHTYNIDYIAVGTNMCVWPVVVFNPEIETCPQGTLVEFEHDMCEEGLGLITINVSGGVAPYILTWYNGQDSLGSVVLDTVGNVTIDSLSAGDYCFKIIDAEGCEN